ncbi:MAG: transcriptional repressor [Dehalococcoidia bacterium]|nr:transcriptional repressor [Dehalococcoidia bacterium]
MSLCCWSAKILPACVEGGFDTKYHFRSIAQLLVSLDSVREQLENNGHRYTQTRGVVIDAIAASSHGFSADGVYTSLPTVGRATVYRTIKLLLQLGVLCKVALQNGSPRYSMAASGHHHHVICIRCGSISDFSQCNLDDLAPRLASALGREPVGHRLEVYTLCSECEGSPEVTLVRGGQQHA